MSPWSNVYNDTPDVVASDEKDDDEPGRGRGLMSPPKRGSPDESGRERWRAMRAVVYLPAGTRCLIAASSGMSSMVRRRASVSPVKYATVCGSVSLRARVYTQFIRPEGKRAVAAGSTGGRGLHGYGQVIEHIRDGPMRVGAMGVSGERWEAGKRANECSRGTQDRSIQNVPKCHFLRPVGVST